MSYEFQSEKKLNLSQKRFKVHYVITAENEKLAREIAHDITVEQTVEFPFDLVPAFIKEQGIVGKIELCEKISDNKFLFIISYANETAGNELTQFLNVLFGNISIKPNIKIVKIDLNTKDNLEFKKFLPGPKFGVKKIRQLWGIENRPMICSALKPMGLSANDLAILAGEFALGKVDLIKDDHGLSNQEFSLFSERVELCQKKILKINPQTIYAPNITGPVNEIKKRAKFCKEMGVKALLISPALTGFDMIRELSTDEEINLPIIAHPAFMGSFVTSNNNGFSHEVMFGTLMRLIGADVSIYPNFGGRFSFSKSECLEIVKGCSEDYFDLSSIFPAPGGGMNFENIPMMKEVYGNDVIYLMGGGLFRAGNNLSESCLKLKKLICS